MNTPNDTIVAPATAAGGAIAIVRMSGPSALAICDTVFSGARRAGEAAGYTVLYGTIADGARVLDDVLVTVFRAPHSYTGEDVVEISCHGSRYIVRELLALLVRRGARMATPGEFTSRAFLGGKLDLSQAEAVADLIASGSRAAHTLATDQMRGGYSAELETLRGELLRLASLLELELDFGEEEVEFADRTELRAAMERIGAKIDRLIDSFALGNAIKEGVAVAIVGAPNVGKSTLLNRLLAIGYTFVFELLLLVMLALQGMHSLFARFADTLPFFRHYAAIVAPLQRVASIGRIVSVPLLFGLLLLIYTYVPGGRRTPRSQLPGTIFATAGWLVFSRVFSFYILHFWRLSYIYGSLTAVILIILWLYVIINLLFIGAGINAEMNGKTEQ